MADESLEELGEVVGSVEGTHAAVACLSFQAGSAGIYAALSTTK